jgi:hypothetical protein
MQEALLVFTGAVVGGVMSALASNWSSRRQYIRETRVDIFRRLLPSVHDGGPDRPRPPREPRCPSRVDGAEKLRGGCLAAGLRSGIYLSTPSEPERPCS